MLLSAAIYERTSAIVVGIIPATIVDEDVFLYYDTKRNDYYFLDKKRVHMRVKVVLQCADLVVVSFAILPQTGALPLFWADTIIFNANECVVQNQRIEIYQDDDETLYIETNLHHLNKRNFAQRQRAYIVLNVNTYDLLLCILLQKTLFSQRKKMPMWTSFSHLFTFFFLCIHRRMSFNFTN